MCVFEHTKGHKHVSKLTECFHLVKRWKTEDVSEKHQKVICQNELVKKKKCWREMTNLSNMVLVPLWLWLLTELARWHLMTLFFSGETGLMQGYEETFCVLWFSQKHQSINGQHFNISSITQLNMQPKHQHELHLLRTTLKPGSSENYKIIFNMMLCLTLYVPCSTVSHIFLFCYNPPLNEALIWFSLIQAEHL